MFNWKLKDVIMVSIFSVIFSFIYLGAVYFANFLATILAPFGLAPFAYEILFGVWFMASTFVPYIVQRSGVAVVSEVLSALIEGYHGKYVWTNSYSFWNNSRNGAGACIC